MAEPEQQPSPQQLIKKSTPFILGAFVLVIPLIWFGLWLTAEERERGHDFIAALREERFAEALDMCSPELQKHLVNAEGLAAKTNVEAIPGSVWWTEIDSRGSDVILKSSTKTWWSRSGVTIFMHYESDEWRVTRMTAGRDGQRMELAVPRKRN